MHGRKAPKLAFAVLLLALALLIGLRREASAGSSPPPGGGDWPQYRYDAQSTWFNPGSFTAGDVAALQPFWSRPTSPPPAMAGSGP